MKKLLGVAALGLLTSACGQGNLYSMPADQAYAKLVETKIVPSGKGPFGKLHIAARGDGAGTVRWAIVETGLKMYATEQVFLNKRLQLCLPPPSEAAA